MNYELLLKKVAELKEIANKYNAQQEEQTIKSWSDLTAKIKEPHKAGEPVKNWRQLVALNN